ncbi:hypothetical protein Deba_0593 [Desulfarculus baarsii DSM 2075]|uniref:Cache domain-containing protein n=1 Tax=Desulfarculus baarsii (strain ATCC 33931 / DSM 2075 / LMG 7858 / VKM B-1802 / 2st14) TaxID=644282 RepID=E1QEH9_DESB2|nr:hypothetical protein [Desulfarculus baarsii]ADK83965.1 hypothetical protein Deba_0593 [Desulfarculus baarsii DSM 2075]
MHHYAQSYRAFLAAWALALLVLLAVGCERNRGSEAAQGFVSGNKELIDNLSTDLAQALAAADDAKANKIVDDFFAQAQADKRPLNVGILVLGAKGQVISSRYPDPKDKTAVIKSEDDFNYSQYKKIDKVLSKGKTTSTILYTVKHKVYMVCSPLKHGNAIVGALCVARVPSVMGPPLEIPDAEFLELSFND